MDSNSRTGGISCVRFTEKLKGAEKVAMQVLHVVITYDCISKIHVMRKNTNNYIMYIRKYWVDRIHCLPTQCNDWVGGCPPCPLGSRAPAPGGLQLSSGGTDIVHNLVITTSRHGKLGYDFTRDQPPTHQP